MNKLYADFLLEKTKKDYNLIARHFSDTRTKVWPEIKFLVDDYLVAGEKILDVGCGNGRLYELLKNKEVEYFGIDNSEELIKIAKTLYPQANFQVADCFNLPFVDNYFDKVYVIAVLHHIPSKEYRIKVLAEIKRVLKPEGKLFLTVWNLFKKNHLAKKLFFKYGFLKLIGVSRLDFYDIFYPWKNPEGKVLAQRYIHLFRKKELIKLAEKSGFKVEKISENDNIVLVLSPYSLMDKTRPSGG